jgi:hypothetical protein
MTEVDEGLEQDGQVSFGELIDEKPPISEEDASLLDALADQRNVLSETRETFIPIQGYEGSGMTLYAQYRLVDGDELSKIGRRITQQFGRKQVYERNLYASLDTMIAACTGIFIDRGDGEKIQLKHNGMPINGYTQELAEALRFADEIDPRQPARSVLLGIFGNNIVAIQQHSVWLGRWMGDTSADVNVEFMEAEGNL